VVFHVTLPEGVEEMRRGVWRVLCAVLLFCSAVSANAQENPLELYTGDVDLIIRLREPDQAVTKVVKLVNKVQPGAGDLLEAQGAAALGALISNPGLTGVDQSRDWYAGVYFQEEGKAPLVVFAIPALRTEDLVSALGPRMKTKVEGRMVLYTDGEEIPTGPSALSTARKMDETTTKALTTGDLSVYVNVDHLSQVYDEQIELFKDKVLEGLNQLRFAQPQSGIDMNVIVEMYGTIAEGFFQGLEDSENSVISISLSDTDVFVRSTVAFATDSAASKLLAKNPTSEMPQLNKLPANLPYYYGLSVDLKDLTQWGMKLTAGMTEDKAAAENIEAATKKLEPVSFGRLVGAFDIAESPVGAFRGYSLMEAQPIDIVKTAFREISNAMSTFDSKAFKQTATIQVDAETYGNEKADVVTIKQEISPESDPGGIQTLIQNVMFGESGMESRTVYRKDTYAQTVGGGEKAMKDLLKALDGTRTNNLVKYREGLMPQANFYQFVDLAGLIGKGLKTASQVEGFPLPINKQMVDSLGLQPSYIGVAAGSVPNRANFELRIPVEQIVGIAKLSVMIGASAQGMQSGL
jgi:hypothetical protein